MRLGFTGTKRGMTEVQKRVVSGFVQLFQPVQAHHGDCVGADSDFHDIIRDIVPNCLIVVHPPTEPRNRAYRDGDRIRGPLPFMVRDDNIIRESTLMISTPEGDEHLHSGTWATIRHTRNFNKGLIIVWPDGAPSFERLAEFHLEFKKEHKQYALDFLF